MSSGLAAGLTAASIIALRLILHRYAPTDPVEVQIAKRMQRFWLGRRLGVLTAAVLSTIVAGTVWFAVCMGLQALRLARFPETVLVVPVGSPLFMFSAVLVGLPIGVFTASALFKMRSPMRYEFYWHDTWAAEGLEIDRLIPHLKTAGVLLSLAGVLLGLLAIDSYTAISAQTIEQNSLWQIRPTLYRFDDVSRVAYSARTSASDAQIVERSSFVVYFSDGSTWQTGAGNPAIEREAVIAISERSGKPIEVIDVIE